MYENQAISIGHAAAKMTNDESALRVLHTQFSNANNQMTEILLQVEKKLHAILDLQKEASDAPQAKKPSRFGNGITYELECQVNTANDNTARAEMILKHLSQIV